MAGKSSTGYGILWIEGRNWTAHRIAWTLTNGPIPDGLYVLHQCDNRPCANPNHLFLGTNGDNQRDAAKKGKSRGKVMFGENNPAAKLSETDVREIRRLEALGVKRKTLAAKWSISYSQISSILTRQTWKHI